MHPVLLRAAPWRALLGLTATGAGLGAAGLALGSGAGLIVVQLALVVLGSAAACSLDEPAAAVVTACPLPRAYWVLSRAAAAAPSLVAGGALVTAWWARSAVDAVLLLEGAGPWAAGFALALLARRRLDEPADVVAPPFVLVLVAVLLWNPLHRWVDLFPLGPGLRTAAGWWCVVGAAVACLALAVPERRWR